MYWPETNCVSYMAVRSHHFSEKPTTATRLLVVSMRKATWKEKPWVLWEMTWKTWKTSACAESAEDLLERSSGNESLSVGFIELKSAQMHNVEVMMLNMDDTFHSPTDQSNGQV